MYLSIYPNTTMNFCIVSLYLRCFWQRRSCTKPSLNTCLTNKWRARRMWMSAESCLLNQELSQGCKGTTNGKKIYIVYKGPLVPLNIFQIDVHKLCNLPFIYEINYVRKKWLFMKKSHIPRTFSRTYFQVKLINLYVENMSYKFICVYAFHLDQLCLGNIKS